MTELRAIMWFFAGMAFASASVGGLAGWAFAWWRKSKSKNADLLCSIAAGVLRGLPAQSSRPHGVLIPTGVNAIAVDFGQLATALENRNFYYAPIAVARPPEPEDGPPGGWNADDVGERWPQ